MEEGNVYDPEVVERIHHLVRDCGGDPDSLDGSLITQIIQTSLKLLIEKHDTGQLKLITHAIKEMRYAYRVFNQYKGKPCLTLFGSARTKPNEPDYEAAKLFGRTMAEKGWMCMTGGAHGIMKAGLESIEKEARFGLSIRLPFEPTNTFLMGDPKLITFRYFFIRKLMFLAHSDAIAAFPGGFGTQDELFEVLTLLQTGKSNPIPVVLVEGKGGEYWQNWGAYIEENFLKRGTVSPEDASFYYIAPSIPRAIEYIEYFYKRYHSCRYLGEIFIIRLLQPLSPDQFDQLNEKFSDIVASGKIEPSDALSGENDHLDLPRLIFHHKRSHYGRVRQLIDEINSFPLG